MCCGLLSWKRYYRAGITAHDGPVGFIWVNYWAYPGREWLVASNYAEDHGLGVVVVVETLPWKKY